MLLRLYHEQVRKIKSEAETVPQLKELEKLEKDAGKKRDYQDLITEREQVSHRLALFLADAQELLNVYHRACAEYQEHQKLSQFAQTDNALSREFVRRFCPDRMKTTSALPTLDDESFCPVCSTRMMERSSTNGTCRNCGYYIDNLVENTEETCSYDRISQAASHRKFTYKKINHFRETIRQAQGKTNPNIPKHVIEAIREEIKKRRITQAQLKPDMMRLILRRLGYSEFYEEKVYLTQVFNPSFRPIQMSEADEEILCSMFVRIEKPFEKIKKQINRARKNFISYPGTARRFCEILAEEGLRKEDEAHAQKWKTFAEAFPLLKDDKLRRIQDDYFHAICEDSRVKWTFIPTVGDLERGQSMRKRKRP